MQVEIRKTERWHEIDVRRADGVSLALRSPDRKFSPPHDLVHLVVERALGLDGGFWDCVARGAKFRGMRVKAGRQRPQAEARSKALIKESQARLKETEVFVGLFQEALLSKDQGSASRLCRALEHDHPRLKQFCFSRGEAIHQEGAAARCRDIGQGG